MNYHELEKIQDEAISPEQIEALDSYLASLSKEEGNFLYPELISKIISVEENIVTRLLIHCTEYQVCSSRFESYCPTEDVAFNYTFNESDLDISQECDFCSEGQHTPSSDCHIEVSFRLNEIKAKKKLSKNPFKILLKNIKVFPLISSRPSRLKSTTTTTTTSIQEII